MRCDARQFPRHSTSHAFVEDPYTDGCGQIVIQIGDLLNGVLRVCGESPGQYMHGTWERGVFVAYKEKSTDAL